MCVCVCVGGGGGGGGGGPTYAPLVTYNVIKKVLVGDDYIVFMVVASFVVPQRYQQHTN